MTIALPSASEIAAALIAREELPPEKGDIGPQGKAGEDGGFGPPGEQGPKGNPGRDGVDGAPGDLGPVGPQGKQGDRGLKGDKGDKGDEGEKGDRGPIGPTGASGSGRSFFPRGGGSSSGSGLPSGGTVGQVVTNTAPGTGTWQDGSGLPPQWTDGGNGDVTATVDDTAKTAITVEGFTGQTADVLAVRSGLVAAYVQTALNIADAEIVFTAVTPGTGGNAIAVEYIGGGSVSVAVVGSAVQVTFVDSTSTADDIIAAITGDAPASALITAARAPGNDGSGLPTASHIFSFAGGAVATDLLTVSPRGTTEYTATDPTAPALSLRAAPGATLAGSTVIQMYDDAGNRTSDFDASGHLEVRADGSGSVSIDPTGYINIQVASAVAAGAEVIATTGFTVRKNGGGTKAQISSNVSGDKVLVLGSQDEDSDALSVIGGPDYNGGEFRVWGDGTFSTKAHAARADGDIAAGECTFWFDQTNGAPALKIKAKQANGTVVSATVPLT